MRHSNTWRGVFLFFADSAVFGNIYTCADCRNNKNNQNHYYNFIILIFLWLIIINGIALVMFFFNNRFKIFRFFSTLIFPLHLFILRSSCNYGRRCVKLFTESVNILRSFFRVNLQSAAERTDNISRYFLCNRVRNHQFIIEFP